MNFVAEANAFCRAVGSPAGAGSRAGPRVPRCRPAILWASPCLQAASVQPSQLRVYAHPAYFYLFGVFSHKFSKAVLKFENCFKNKSGRKPEALSWGTQSIFSSWEMADYRASGPVFRVPVAANFVGVMDWPDVSFHYPKDSYPNTSLSF